MNDHPKECREMQPIAVGTGLLALDVVFSENEEASLKYYAGGTCGNVLTILSYLGWSALPISRLASDSASKRILGDLERWGVSVKYVTTKADGSSPVIIERIGRTANGQPYHSFSWRCPECGAHLPGYKPVLATTALGWAQQLPEPKVFFFDRVSRGALLLAKQSADRGAVVIFEPSGIGDARLFREAWSLAHIVKYSHDRLRDIADLHLPRSHSEGAQLEIETLGANGLRFHSHLPKSKSNGWIAVPSFSVETLRDAAGAGDWCTAGLLDKLARQGLEGFHKASTKSLTDALRFGQALSAWNCQFEGARGGMYEVALDTFRQQVNHILSGDKTQLSTTIKTGSAASRIIGRLCRACKKPNARNTVRKTYVERDTVT
jgi:sugar/nucleoside kinase (ribokinase family)